MSKLQELLDKKFPLTVNSSDADRRLYEVWRDIFTEGYNARKEEETPILEGRDVILKQCRDYYKHGMSIGAVKHYMESTGCDLQTAMDAVGPNSVFALNVKKQINNG